MNKYDIYEPRIELSKPNLDLDILDNIRETIETGWVSTGGRFISDFEEMLATYSGIKQFGGGVKTFQSGTAALHLALIALKVQKNEEIIVPTLTFIATVNPVNYVGAFPIFMDCGDDLNMDPDKVEEFLETECTYIDGVVTNKSSGRRIKGIILVHVFGNPANIERFIEIKEKYNLFLIEDAAEAIGSYYTSGKYEGRHCGTIGDIGIYSFNANKIITSASGGALITTDESILHEVNFLGVQAKSDPLRYIHDEIGYNYRMTNISAAFGVSQLKRIESFIEIKQKNYQLYKEGLQDIKGIELLDFNSKTRANMWFYSILIDDEVYGLDREGLLQLLDERNIATRPIWGLIHLQKPYLDCQSYRIEKAIFYSEKILNIPCSTSLTPISVERVVRGIEELSNGYVSE